jgi:hypothetical protein
MRRTSRPIRCPNPWLLLALCLHHRATGPPNSSGSTSHLIRRRTGSHARSRFALAERLRRKTDWIHPTRVPRPCDRPGRGAPTRDSASLCPLLQRFENRTDRWTKTRHSRARFSGSVASGRMLFSVDCITSTCESKFSVHTSRWGAHLLGPVTGALRITRVKNEGQKCTARCT